MSGEFETCADPAARLKAAHEQAKARPADAPSPLAGCTNAINMQPGGSMHHELSCDRAKGAKATFRSVSDGTPNDLHMHVEGEALNSTTGATRKFAFDSHFVRLGACPADLAPGQMRRLGGPILEAAEASRILASAQGAAP